MDAFSKNKYLLWAVIILIVLNLVNLGFFWYGRGDHHRLPMMPQGGRMMDEKHHAIDFLANDLNLNENDKKEFKKLAEDHFKTIHKIMGDIFERRKAIIDEAFNQNSDVNKINQLTKEIADLHANLEKTNFEHFNKLKSLVKPDQFAKLKDIMKEVMMMRRPMHQMQNPPMMPPPRGDCDKPQN